MNETLLVLLISIGFGLLVFYFSHRYEKKNDVNIKSWLWGVIACALVWAIAYLTDGFLDIGSR